MNPIPTVFLDTNILKFSATSLLRLRPRKSIIDWGHTKSEIICHDLIHYNPNTRIANLELKKEADLLEQVAKLVKEGGLKAVMQIEAELESWGLPKMLGGGKFYGAPIKIVDAPVEYSRAITWPNIDAKDLQQNFLTGIKNDRFTELQKITGAFQGKGKSCSNQLLDAFHIWCAEHNRCDYFPTLDFRLIREVSKHKLKPILPILVIASQLLHKI